MPGNRIIVQDADNSDQIENVGGSSSIENTNTKEGETASPHSDNSTQNSGSTQSLHSNGSVARTLPDNGERRPTTTLTRTTTDGSYAGPVHSIFTENQKRFIVFMASWAGFFSPVSGQIYFPALNALSADLKVSNTLINLTLTSYMIFQGLAPTFIGDLADTMGRRLAYVVCFVIYIAANIGLALQNSYAALFVLRCIQSSGSSGTIAMASGVVSDIATASERGAYMGYTLAGSLLGPAIGPVLGGILSEFLGWRAIFWFLMIMGSTFLIFLLIFFPETARNQVGNGSIPPKGYNMSLMNYLAVRKARNEQPKEELERIQSHTTLVPKRKFRFPNPLSSLHILWDKENAMLLFYNAILFAAFYDITAVIPSQFAEIYNFNDLQIGLCYIPFGFGSLCAALVNGQLLDRNFARWCRKLGLKIKKGRQQDLRHFPIEKARLQIAIPATYITLSLTLVFGWVLDAEGPLALQLVVLFFTSLSMSMAFNVTSTLIIDFYPRSPATATAANNLVRCWLGAGATAAVIPMIEAMGRGWTFTFLALFLAATSPLLWFVYFKGMGWREERRLREENELKLKKSRKAGKAERAAGKSGRHGEDIEEESSGKEEKEQQERVSLQQQGAQWRSDSVRRTISHDSAC